MRIITISAQSDAADAPPTSPSVADVSSLASTTAGKDRERTASHANENHSYLRLIEVVETFPPPPGFPLLCRTEPMAAPRSAGGVPNRRRAAYPYASSLCAPSHGHRRVPEQFYLVGGATQEDHASSFHGYAQGRAVGRGPNTPEIHPPALRGYR